MKLIYFHNWYYDSAEEGEQKAKESIEIIKKNISSFPFKDKYFEIASAEAKTRYEHYWLLLFLVSTDVIGDDSVAIKEKLEKWIKSIDIWWNNDRSVMIAKFNDLQKCIEDRYPNAYILHTVISQNDIPKTTFLSRIKNIFK